MTTEAEVAPAAVEAVVPSPDAPADAKVDKAEADAKAESKDAPKEVPKPDQPRLPKPDRAALDASIAELQEAADVQQARIETLKRAIESRREKRKNITSGSQDTRARIGELNAAFSAHMVRPVPSRDATVVPQLSRAPDPPDLRNPRGPAFCPSAPPPRTDRARAPRPAVDGDDAIATSATAHASRDRRARAPRDASRDAPAIAPRRFGCLRPRVAPSANTRDARAIASSARASLSGPIFFPESQQSLPRPPERKREHSFAPHPLLRPSRPPT